MAESPLRLQRSSLLFLAGTIIMILLAIWLTWISGPFPIPWNDEFVFTDVGHRFLQSGHLNEAPWAMYEPRFGQGLVNLPPLYPILIGFLHAITGGSLLSMRLVHGTLLIGGLAAWVRSRERPAYPDAASQPLLSLLFLVSLVANPYFLRAAFFIRPDGFILLAFLWIAGHIWSKTFLATRANALKAGAIIGLAGQIHFSALILIPLFGFGLLLALRREGRTILLRLRDAVLLACALIGPYFAWFLPKIVDWWRLVHETQGAQKYSHLRMVGTFLWPPDFLVGRLPYQHWAPGAWGPTTTYWIWIISLIVLPVIALRIAVREHSFERGITYSFLGILATWFFIRFPEMWFSSLGALTLQAVMALQLREQSNASWGIRTFSCLTLIHVISFTLFLNQADLPTWEEHKVAVRQIEAILGRALPDGPKNIYVSALPDPSVDLTARWPNMRITRGIDFPSYQVAYADKVLVEPQAWILGEPWVRPEGSDIPRAFLFDWGGVLARSVQRGDIELYPVRWGGYRIWVALRRQENQSQEPSFLPQRPTSSAPQPPPE